MILVGISKSTPSENIAQAIYGVYSELKKLPHCVVEYSHLDNGAPYLKGAPESLNISISHSGDYVVCALSSAPVGVDIQLKKEVDYRKIACRYGFSAKNLDEFYQKFTLSEANAKLSQKGLPHSLQHADEIVGKNYRFIPNYTLSVTPDEEVSFVFL